MFIFNRFYYFNYLIKIYIIKVLFLTFNNNLYFSISQIWDGNLAETSHITTIGNIIYTNFPILILLTSIILLLSMIGSILITIKQ